MGWESIVTHANAHRFGSGRGGDVDESVDAQRHRDAMRFFLVACHQASVSVEAMSTYLGVDTETVRTELLLGIEAWNAAQRRTSETVDGSQAAIAAARV